MTTTPATRFAAGFAALHAAHWVADHWVQTSHQAAAKARPGWRGRAACAGHVASYTATAALALAAVDHRTRLGLSPRRVAVALTFSAVTHYMADRRTPLRRLAELAGRGEFYRLGACRPGHNDNPTLGTGAYALDQSYHTGMLLVAALILA